MKHVVFALFESRADADAAIEQLIANGKATEKHVSVVIHRDAIGSAELDETVQHEGEATGTNARRGVVDGALIGATTGAVLGTLLAGPLGLLAGGPLVGILFGAGAGSIYGALSAGLVGLGLTDSELQELARDIESGNVLVTVTAEQAETEGEIEAILREHRGRVAEKHAF